MNVDADWTSVPATPCAGEIGGAGKADGSAAREDGIEAEGLDVSTW
jgi:hypothetical protein